MTPKPMSANEKLRSAQEALQWAYEFFVARDEMNAKIHCAPMRLSEITVRVGVVLKKIDDKWDGRL